MVNHIASLFDYNQNCMSQMGESKAWHFSEIIESHFCLETRVYNAKEIGSGLSKIARNFFSQRHSIDLYKSCHMKNEIHFIYSFLLSLAWIDGFIEYGKEWQNLSNKYSGEILKNIQWHQTQLIVMILLRMQNTEFPYSVVHMKWVNGFEMIS